jgi:hypothetical protein
MRETPLPADARRDLLERMPAAVAGHWAAVALAAIGIALAVAAVRARRLPRLLVVGVPALIGGLMGARAGWARSTSRTRSPTSMTWPARW